MLLTIIDYVFAPRASLDDVAYVRLLIRDHHTKFKLLYPDSPIIPKMHYMVHIPVWMERYMHMYVIVVVNLYCMYMFLNKIINLNEFMNYAVTNMNGVNQITCNLHNHFFCMVRIINCRLLKYSTQKSKQSK